MTNKTITLGHAVAERLVSAVDNGALFRPDDLEALRAALAEPVPPAGGEPEVVAYLTNGGTNAMTACNMQVAVWNAGRPLILLEDHRAHVTRLQAEVRAAKQHEYRAQVKNSELNDELAKARELAVLVHQGMNGLLALEEDADVLDYLGAKAAELLGVGQTPSALDAFLSNQSAPADKGTPDDCAHSEANNRGCPECGKEFKCAPALIETLRDNGDRIAMEATIAQQAQRIADLEADKGQGEPVAWRYAGCVYSIQPHSEAEPLYAGSGGDA